MKFVILGVFKCLLCNNLLEYLKDPFLRSALICVSFACQIFQSTSIIYVYQFQLVASVCSSHHSITVRFSKTVLAKLFSRIVLQTIINLKPILYIKE